MQKITPCLWFDNNAEEAVNHYPSIFKNSKITNVLRCDDAGPGHKGSLLRITFHSMAAMMQMSKLEINVESGFRSLLIDHLENSHGLC